MRFGYDVMVKISCCDGQHHWLSYDGKVNISYDVMVNNFSDPSQWNNPPRIQSVQQTKQYPGLADQKYEIKLLHIYLTHETPKQYIEIEMWSTSAEIFCCPKENIKPFHENFHSFKKEFSIKMFLIDCFDQHYKIMFAVQKSNQWKKWTQYFIVQRSELLVEFSYRPDEWIQSLTT